eukprot:gnl/Chilomastix_cuspidata/1953.p1 GENE.gnl/Chilomastix_cuspidata/1953~~gnl/Chilomastix_cuspidata/1953.p1  ORF type:complete len:930 (-),score=522.62 gnl/Chilomastix_cuspidata/1953:27-2816(-)
MTPPDPPRAFVAECWAHVCTPPEDIPTPSAAELDETITAEAAAALPIAQLDAAVTGLFILCRSVENRATFTQTELLGALVERAIAEAEQNPAFIGNCVRLLRLQLGSGREAHVYSPRLFAAWLRLIDADFDAHFPSVAADFTTIVEELAIRDLRAQVDAFVDALLEKLLGGRVEVLPLLLSVMEPLELEAKVVTAEALPRYLALGLTVEGPRLAELLRLLEHCLLADPACELPLERDNAFQLLRLCHHCSDAAALDIIKRINSFFFFRFREGGAGPIRFDHSAEMLAAAFAEDELALSAALFVLMEHLTHAAAAACEFIASGLLLDAYRACLRLGEPAREHLRFIRASFVNAYIQHEYFHGADGLVARAAKDAALNGDHPSAWALLLFASLRSTVDLTPGDVAPLFEGAEHKPAMFYVAALAFSLWFPEALAGALADLPEALERELVEYLGVRVTEKSLCQTGSFEEDAVPPLPRSVLALAYSGLALLRGPDGAAPKAREETLARAWNVPFIGIHETMFTPALHSVMGAGFRAQYPTAHAFQQRLAQLVGSEAAGAAMDGLCMLRRHVTFRRDPSAFFFSEEFLALLLSAARAHGGHEEACFLVLGSLWRLMEEPTALACAEELGFYDAAVEMVQRFPTSHRVNLEGARVFRAFLADDGFRAAACAKGALVELVELAGRFREAQDILEVVLAAIRLITVNTPYEERVEERDTGLLALLADLTYFPELALARQSLDVLNTFVARPEFDRQAEAARRVTPRFEKAYGPDHFDEPMCMLGLRFFFLVSRTEAGARALADSSVMEDVVRFVRKRTDVLGRGRALLFWSLFAAFPFGAVRLVEADAHVLLLRMARKPFVCEQEEEFVLKDLFLISRASDATHVAVVRAEAWVSLKEYLLRAPDGAFEDIVAFILAPKLKKKSFVPVFPRFVGVE